MPRTLPCLLLLVVSTFGQVALTTGPFASAGSSQHKHVVKDAAGNLYALSVAQDASGNRPLKLQVSPDGGATWLPLTVAINDPTSGLSGTNLTNGCCLAIDGTGVLHIVWASYYYPSFYAQHYRQYDPSGGTLSPIVSLTGVTGAASTSRTSAMNIAVDASDTIWIAAHGAQNWRTHLIASQTAGASTLAFTDLGTISTSASAQNARLAVDNAGLVHCSYYRNTGSGDYYHRIYDPATGWQSSTQLGNSIPSNDYLGTLAADDLGFVHALYGEDLGPNTTWNFFYRRWDAFGLWSAASPVFSVTTAQYSGVANYRIFALACEEATGKAIAVFRDLAAGGQLEVVQKDVAATSFTSLTPLTPPSTAQHDYYTPSIRGAMWPPFNRTGTDLDITWRQNPTPGPYQLVFQRVATGAPTPTLSLTTPATVGAATSLDISSPADPFRVFFCGFSTGTNPGTTLPNGQFVPLNDDWLVQFSMAPGNGVFFNNLSTLNAIGSASVIIAVPNIAALSGMTLYSAFVVEDPNATSWQLGTISPSLAITIQ